MAARTYDMPCLQTVRGYARGRIKIEGALAPLFFITKPPGVNHGRARRFRFL